MQIQEAIPSVRVGDVTIMDIGEESEAVIVKKPPNQRFHYILHFVVSGKGYYETSNAQRNFTSPLDKNSVFAVYKYDSVRYYSDPADPLHYYWVGFDGAESEQILRHIGFSENLPVTEINSPERIAECFDRLFVYNGKKDKYLLASGFFMLVSELRECNARKILHNADENLNLILYQAENYIKMNFHKNIKVNDVVNALHIDRSYFSKLFKHRYNVSPHEYILSLRLLTAENLLKSGNYSIDQIISSLNFTDQKVFSKQFKAFFGFPPLKYKKMLQSRSGESENKNEHAAENKKNNKNN